MKHILLFLVFFFSNILISISCFWDYDTIEMERQQFPSVIELISGKFLRHSPEYHHWRIKDREAKLKEFPDSLPLFDDLAVSYSKIHNQKKAIQLMLEKEKKQKGLYETYANLGTFYIHDYQLKNGIKYIRKAIKINPDAHFGREIYQLYMAEYVLGKMKGGKIRFPLNNQFLRHPDQMIHTINNENFYGFLLRKHLNQLDSVERSNTYRLPKKEIEKAIKGLLGMMKFGDHASPVLLELLGDLLMSGGDLKGARQLAARAYFKASYSFEDQKTVDVYHKKIAFAIFHQFTNKRGTQFTIFELETLLKEEILEGEKFYNKIREDEIKWIKSEANPELEFGKKYYKSPIISKRIQHGSGERKKREVSRKYIRDSKIGRVVDYRPVPKTKVIEIDSSIFEKKDTAIPPKESIIKPLEKKEISSEEPISVFSKWYFYFGTILSIIGIFFLWRRTR